MMIPCALCQKSFQTFRQLKVHMQFYHPSVNIFACASTDCFRKFQLFNSYTRHYQKNHMMLRDEAVSDVSPDFPYIDAQPTGSQNTLNSADNLSTVSLNGIPTLDTVGIPFETTVARLFSTLYANPQIPQNTADVVFMAVKDIFNNSVLPLITEHDSNTLKNNILSTLSKLDSHYKRLKYFSDLGTFIAPKPYIVGRRYDYVKRDGTRIYEAVECQAHIVPLRIVLEKFLSLPDILQKTLHYMNKLMTHNSSQTIEHFMHGSFWKSRQSHHDNKLVMPLFLQIDDFEPLNALGSHSSIHKLGAAYISLPCLPECYTSQLSNIFLVLLYHSSDRVEFGNRIIFQPLIDEFNYLTKHGISFDLPDFKGTIFFELGLILGDNLGLHSITGFVESFSSNVSCRNCKVTKNVMKHLFREDRSLLRNKQNYTDDLRTNNCSLTGVKEECIWLRVENFDLFSQIGVDVMHDLNEGVMKYVMCELIVVLVDKCKYLTIQLINKKLASFDYGPDNADKPVSQTMENLRKGNMRLSASEIGIFCKYFGIMFGEMVPRHDKYWAIYIQLMLVVEIVTSTGFRSEQTINLQYLVADLCEMFTLLFDQTLKPKFHNLLHYHSAMLKFGPLRYLSSMRFEAKHRPNKLASKSSNNNMNMTFSIAKRHQLMLNDVLLKRKLNSPFSFGSLLNVTLHEASILAQKFDWVDNEKIKTCSWVSVFSSYFRYDYAIIHNVGPDIVHFAKIRRIYVYNDSKIVFMALPMVTVAFDAHYHAYNVIDDQTDTELIYINYDTMQYQFPCNIVNVGYGNSYLEQYVILRKPL